MSNPTDEENDFSEEDPEEEFEEFPDDGRLGLDTPAFTRRAGHVAVSYQGSVVVWGGYMENQVCSISGQDIWRQVCSISEENTITE